MGPFTLLGVEAVSVIMTGTHPPSVFEDYDASRGNQARLKKDQLAPLSAFAVDAMAKP